MDLPISSVKVLIAEDHFLSRQMISNALRDRGVVHTYVAADGRQARAMIDDAQLAGKPFHVVFLDWEMPVMTGIDVLKHFRAQPQFNTTAFVMATAVSEHKSVIDAVKAGATAYLIKPTSQLAITKKFDEMLSWLRER